MKLNEYLINIKDDLVNLLLRLQNDYNSVDKFEQNEEDRLIIGNILDMMDYDFEEDNEKLSSSFNLEIVYNDDEKIMYIGTSDSSGEKYKCEKYSDIVKNVKSYCDNYLILDDETESDVNLEHEL